jgi:hypothetical protein
MNITVDRKVIEQALGALVATYQGKDKTNQVTESITSLRTALGQQYMTNAAGELEPVTIVQTGVGVGKPVQKPVWWMLKTGHGTEFKEQLTDELRALTWKGKPMWVPLYTAPPQHKPLSLDELWRVFTSSGLSQFHQRDGVVEYKYEKCIEEFARAIEAAHGIGCRKETT